MRTLTRQKKAQLKRCFPDLNGRQRIILRKNWGTTMKVNYTKNAEFTPEWNGNKKLPENERLTVSITALGFSEFLDIVDSMGDLMQNGGIDGDILTKIKKDGGKAIKEFGGAFKAMGALVGEHATLHNFIGEDDKDITVQDIQDSIFYLPLLLEIFGELVSISTPDEDSEGN